MYLKITKTAIISLFFIILILHLWASFNSAYFYVWWLDLILHALGGFWLALVAMFFFSKSEKTFSEASPYFIFILVLGLVSLGGVFWEFFEYIFDMLFARRGFGRLIQLGVSDTMSDLLFDLVGGVLAQLIFWKKRRR